MLQDLGHYCRSATEQTDASVDNRFRNDCVAVIVRLFPLHCYRAQRTQRQKALHVNQQTFNSHLCDKNASSALLLLLLLLLLPTTPTILAILTITAAIASNSTNTAAILAILTNTAAILTTLT